MSDRLRGLILDFDGTIADTERFGHRVSYNLAFAELGLDWSWDEELYGALLSVAGGKERLLHYLTQYRPRLRDDAIADGLIEKIYRAKVGHFARMASAIPFRPGLLRLVQEAHAAGIAVAIATTGSKAGVEAVLRQHEKLPAMIAVIAGNEEVGRKKPAPDVYLWALDRLGLAADDCVAVEDSSIGLRAALAARLMTVVTFSDYTAKEDFTGACAVLSHLGERDKPAQCLRGAKPMNGIVDLAFLQTCLSTSRVP
ncbi:MAG TPA: HAD-IA family hydrolase [Xanthobacteraceae bacterium]|jgi:HAD superfamily hydrolase (TIGR01509 family)